MDARWKLTNDQRVVLIPGAMWMASWIPASAGLFPGEYMFAWAGVCLIAGAILKRRLRGQREADKQRRRST